MTPQEVSAAIARLLMLAAGPLDTVEQEAAMGAALQVFDGITEFRRLVYALTLRVAEKLPPRVAVGLTSLSDLAAMAMLTNADDPRLPELVDSYPAALLPELATSLLAMWRHACSLAAFHALHEFEVPDHVPTEGR